MPAPRSTIVDEAVTPWYHCIFRCVRRAFLCGQGFEYRKDWIENRLKELVSVFAVELAGFSVMDNHLHLLVRLDSKKAQEWSVDEVVRRWLSIFPLRDTAGTALPVSQERRKVPSTFPWYRRVGGPIQSLGTGEWVAPSNPLVPESGWPHPIPSGAAEGQKSTTRWHNLAS